MKLRWLAAFAALLLAGCITGSDDRDRDRSKGEERAKKYCVQEAKSRGMRVENVGNIDKLGKKQYEVKLRIDSGKSGNKYDKKKGDDFRVLCRYDDKSRRATIN